MFFVDLSEVVLLLQVLLAALHGRLSLELLLVVCFVARDSRSLGDLSLASSDDIIDLVSDAGHVVLSVQAASYFFIGFDEAL